MKITPLLVVDKVEQSLPFWVDRMGFTKAVEVPDGQSIGFALLTRDGAEIMLQSSESVRKDVPRFAPDVHSPAHLFIEVADFPDVVARLRDYPVAVAERTTFYGMREIGVFEPGGHAIMFAAPTKP